MNWKYLENIISVIDANFCLCFFYVRNMFSLHRVLTKGMQHNVRWTGDWRCLRQVCTACICPYFMHFLGYKDSVKKYVSFPIKQDLGGASNLWSLWVWGPPELYSELQCSQGDTVTPNLILLFEEQGRNIICTVLEKVCGAGSSQTGSCGNAPAYIIKGCGIGAGWK